MNVNLQEAQPRNGLGYPAGGSLGAAPAATATEERSVSEPMRVDVAAHLEDFADVWPAVPGGDAFLTAFQSRDYLTMWLRLIAPGQQIVPQFVCVRDASGRPVLLLPFGLRRRRGVRVLSFLDGGISDYNAPVLFAATPNWSAAEFTAVWRQILSALPAFDVLQLDKMLVEVEGRPNPLMHLGASPWECSGHAVAVGKAVPPLELPNARASRRRLKRLDEIAATRFVFASEPSQAADAFDALMQHKNRRFAETQVPGFERIPGSVEFYRSALHEEPLRPHALLAALYCGTTPIAEQWCLVSGKRLLLLVCGNAGGEWSRQSPGRLLNEFLIGWARDQGFDFLDFGVGDESYKAEYCNIRIELAGIRKPMSRRGHAALLLSGTIERVRATSLYHKLRPMKWALIRKFKRQG